MPLRERHSLVYSIVVLVSLLTLLCPSLLSAQACQEAYDQMFESYDANRLDEALHYAGQAKQICLLEYGDWTQEYANVLLNFAFLAEEKAKELELAGKEDESLAYYKKGLDLIGELVGKDDDQYAIKLHNFANRLKSAAQYDSARQAYLEALGILEKSYGRQSSQYLLALENLASLYELMGRGDKADSLSAELDQLRNAGTESIESVGINTAGPSCEELYDKMVERYDAADYQEALDFALQAEEQCIVEFGKEASEHGLVLDWKGNILTVLGRYEEALPAYLGSLENCGKSLGRDHPEYGMALNNLATLYKKMGRYQEAAELYSEAIENCKNSLGVHHSQYGIYLSGLAAIYEINGQFEEALPLYLEALENAEESVGKGHSVYGIRLDNVAGLYKRMGRYTEALPLYETALEICENALGKGDLECAAAMNNLASIYEKMGYYEKALPLNKEALEICEYFLGRDHPNYGTGLNNLALLYQSMGRYEDAMLIFGQALENCKMALGEAHPVYGLRLNNLAYSNQQLGQFSEAEQLYREALENTEWYLGRDHPRYATTLNNLGSLYQVMGRYSDAIALNLEALKITEETVGKDHSSYALRLNQLGLLYYETGLYSEAIPVFMDALDICEISFGKDHPEWGTYRFNLGLMYETMGQYSIALQLYREALSNFEHSLGKQHAQYGAGLSNLSVLYQKMGLYEEAIELSGEAMLLTEEAFGKEHPSYAKDMANLALMHEKTGSFGKALSLYKKAQGIYERTLGRQHQKYGILLNNLGLLHYNLGLYEEAQTLFEKAAKIILESLGEDHQKYGMILNNMALLHQTIGDYEAALSMQLRALENCEQSLGTEHSSYGMQLNNLALLYELMGRDEEALQMYDAALKNYNHSLGKDHSEYGLLLNNMALLQQKLGDQAAALQHYLDALENTQRSLGEDHAQYGLIANNLALLYDASADYENALQMQREAAKNLRGLIDRQFGFMTETEKEAYLAPMQFYFNIYQSFASDHRNDFTDLPAFIYDNEILLKGLILESSTSMRQIIQGETDDTVTGIYRDWQQIRTYLSEQYSKPVAVRDLAVDSLEDAANALERELVSYSSAFEDAQANRHITWEPIRDALRPGEAAIEFISFDYYHKDWTDSTIYAALLLTGETEEPVWIDLFEERQLNYLLALPDRFPLEDMKIDYLYSRGGFEDAVKNIGGYTDKGLYELIWAPIEPHLDSIETIYFCPSGKLNKIAFAALKDAEGTHLMDGYELVQLTSTRQLAMNEEEDTTAISRAAVFGGIDYDSCGYEDIESMEEGLDGITLPGSYIILPEDRSRGTSWDYLPGAAEEAAFIADRLDKNNLEVQLFTGSSASESAFNSMDQIAPGLIHVSTHGFFFPDPSMDERKNQVLRTREEFARFSEDPLLRSGLVMAGANHAWTGEMLPGQLEDGILTAKEISNLDLSSTDLVVLSACETGLGDIKGSEGVFGLQRAFKMAGVDFIMMSLWEVPDDETAEFMMHFYEQWLNGQSIREAFRQTQREMAAKYLGEPFMWAAFVLLE